MDNSNILILMAALILVYTIFYFSQRKYFENFKDDRFHENGSPKTELNDVLYAPEKPFLINSYDSFYPPNSPNRLNSPNHLNPSSARNPFVNESVDNYDASNVFQNQGSKEASKKQISDAMTRYPLDWPVQGSDSQYFQDNQIEYESKLKIPKEPQDEILPDIGSMDAEERKILQTYVPESSKGLLQYSVDDVKTLLEKLYLKKGLIPVVEKSKQGSNVWEIIELKEKNPHIVWEDQNEIQSQIMKQRGESNIDVPYTVSDVASGLDPFQSRNKVT